MKITQVEAIILRQPRVDDGIADGSQDDLVIKISTDEGIVGIGEVDSAPEAVAALVERPSPMRSPARSTTCWSARTPATSSGSGGRCTAG